MDVYRVLKIFELQLSESICRPYESRGGLNAIALSPRATRIYVACAHEIFVVHLNVTTGCVRNASHGICFVSLPSEGGSITQIKIQKNTIFTNGVLLVTTFSGLSFVYPLDDKEEPLTSEGVHTFHVLDGTLTNADDSIWSVSLSPTKPIVAVGANNRTIALFELPALPQLEALKPTIRLVGHRHNVPCVAFALDGRLLSSASIDGRFVVWSPLTRPIPAITASSPDWAWSVAWASKTIVKSLPSRLVADVLGVESRITVVSQDVRSRRMSDVALSSTILQEPRMIEELWIGRALTKLPTPLLSPQVVTFQTILQVLLLLTPFADWLAKLEAPRRDAWCGYSWTCQLPTPTREIQSALTDVIIALIKNLEMPPEQREDRSSIDNFAEFVSAQSEPRGSPLRRTPVDLSEEGRSDDLESIFLDGSDMTESEDGGLVDIQTNGAMNFMWDLDDTASLAGSLLIGSSTSGLYAYTFRNCGQATDPNQNRVSMEVEASVESLLVQFGERQAPENRAIGGFSRLNFLRVMDDSGFIVVASGEDLLVSVYVLVQMESKFYFKNICCFGDVGPDEMISNDNRTWPIFDWDDTVGTSTVNVGGVPMFGFPASLNNHHPGYLLGLEACETPDFVRIYTLTSERYLIGYELQRNTPTISLC